MISPEQNYKIVGFVMGEFVPYSERYRDPFVPIWAEVAANYLVIPVRSGDARPTSLMPTIDNPYRSAGNKISDRTCMVDPETHQGLESLKSQLMGALFPSTGNWIAASKRGREDASAARTVTDLLNYTFDLEGHRRTLDTTILSMLIFGTSHIHAKWNVIERPRVKRGVDVQEGIELQISQRYAEYPVYHDVELSNVDIMDMYVDPGEPELRKMCGAAKRFRTTASKLRSKARQNIYDKAAVHELLTRGNPAAYFKEQTDKSWRPELRNEIMAPTGSIGPATAFEFYGEIPPDVWKYTDGEQWRMITIVADTVVQDLPWPFDHYRVPFYDFTITPMAGRHYGMSPGEATRYQQDFLNVLMMQLADAVVRSVHPPVKILRDANVDVSALMEWSPDMPVLTDRMDGVEVMQVGIDKQSTFALFNQIKQSIRENAGVLGSVQGLGLGINRASATEAAKTFNYAMSRPEMAAAYIEIACLPPLGKGIVGLYQQNLTDTEELTMRVGEKPTPTPLADIHAEFDIKCVGSRIYQSKQNFLALLDRIIQMGQIPQIGNLPDWKEILKRVFEQAGLDEMAQGDLGEAQNVLQNLLMSRLGGPQTGNGNGAVTAAPGGLSTQQGDGQ